jgi:hypothetical protein
VSDRDEAALVSRVKSLPSNPERRIKQVMLMATCMYMERQIYIYTHILKNASLFMNLFNESIS